MLCISVILGTMLNVCNCSNRYHKVYCSYTYDNRYNMIVMIIDFTVTDIVIASTI